MLVSVANHEVAAALRPEAVLALSEPARGDLRIVLTLIKFADCLEQLTRSQGAKLTALAGEPGSAFHFGTPSTGVRLHPVDDFGAHVVVEVNREDLRSIDAVSISAVGLTLKEAS